MTLKHTVVAIAIVFVSVHCGGRVEEAEYTLQGKLIGSGNGHLPPAVFPVELIATSPISGADNQLRDTTITLTFNQPIQMGSLTVNTDTTCTGSFQLSADPNFATCHPVNIMVVPETQVNTYSLRPGTALSANTLYYWKLSGVQSLYGSATMAANSTGSFRTGTDFRSLTNTVGGDCSAAAGTIADFKSAAGTSEGVITPTPIAISGLVVTAITRWGDFFLQKGTEAIMVDISNNSTSCTLTCRTNTPNHLGIKVGDEVCLRATRAHENNSIDRVTDFDQFRKTGVANVNTHLLTLTNTAHGVADNARLVRIKGYLTGKVGGTGNKNHTLSFGALNSITIRDEQTNEIPNLAQNQYIEITAIASQFSSTPQILLDSNFGMVRTDLPLPSYQVAVDVAGVAPNTIKVRLNDAHETTISTDGTHNFTGNPSIQGGYQVTISDQPAAMVCGINRSSGYPTENVTAEIRCSNNPLFAFIGWDATNSAGSYPTYNSNTLTFKMSSTSVGDPSATQGVGSNYTGPYDSFSGQRIDGRGERGFSFGITGTSATKPIVADLPMNFTGKTNVTVRWTGLTWADGSAREYRIRLEYSTTGCSGTFTTVVEYTRATPPTIYPHTQNFTNTITALDNQANACLRWRYYQYHVAGGGNRPPMGVDDIFITAN